MKIDEYYRNLARINLNGSILALIPAILIIGGNLLFLRLPQFMLLTVPFLIVSIFNFQNYLRRTRQSLLIRKNLRNSNGSPQSLFSVEQLVLFFYNTFSPSLAIFFPDGYLAGKIIKYRQKRRKRGKSSKIYALYDSREELQGIFEVHREDKITINVYDSCNEFIGCLEITKPGLMKKEKKELLNANGRFIAAVEGSAFYMDEQVINPKNRQVGRLRRGWMPLEWESHFPESNTPVFELEKGLPENVKLVHLSFLINEFFIKR